MSEPSIHRVDTTGKGWLTFAGFLQTEIGEQLDVAISDVRQRLGGCAGVGGRHVGDAVMDNFFLDVDRVEMSGGA